MSSTQEKLEEILDRLAVRMYDEGQLDKPSLMGRQVAIVNINEAKAQIQVLIDSAKREGAIEELKKTDDVFSAMHQGTPGAGWVHYGELGEYIDDRIAQLEQSEESE